MKKQKALIVSISDNTNCGNRLQNFALYQTLKNLNIDSEVLDNRKSTSRKHKVMTALPAWLLKLVVKLIPTRLIGRNKKLAYIRTANFFAFNKKHIGKMVPLDVVRSEQNGFSHIVIGSDQVWNFEFPLDMRVNFAEFAQNAKISSYAASVGMKKLSIEQQDFIRKHLKRFQFVSVRENDAKELLQPLTDKEVSVVLDPVLLIEAADWSKIAQKPNWFKIDQPYAFVYFLGERTSQFKRIMDDLRNRYHFKLIDVLDTSSVFYTAGPSEFVWLIQNASCVITDSYHATLFSVIFRKPLTVLTGVGERANMSGRFETLQQNLWLNKPFNNYDVDDFMQIDDSEVYKKLSEQKGQSISYLQKFFANQ